jgi:outer membrane protein assembly factor BamB
MKMDAEIGCYHEDTDPVREAPFAFRRTVAGLARRGALLCAAPAAVALALGAPTGACSSSAPSEPLANADVQTSRASLGDGDSSRDGDIVTITGTRSRSGWNSAERKLSPSAVAQQGLTRQWQSPVLDSFTVTNADGTTTTYPPTAWASPLIVKNVAMPGFAKKFGVLVTATGNGFIYAISAPSGNDAGAGAPAPGTILWKTQLTTPAVVRGTGSAVKPFFPIGVLSTPVIDAHAKPPRIYVTSADATAGWQVFAVSLLDGSILPGWPVTINDAVLEPVNQNGPGSFTFDVAGRVVQRSALNLSPDRKLLYVPFGGLRDLAAGWMVTVDTNAAAVASSFSGAAMTTQIANAGMWGQFGPAVDDDGTMFMTTGNSPVGLGPTPHVYGESLLAFAPGSTLGLTGRYTPFNYCDMEAQDTDLSGAAPLLITLDPATTSTPRLAVLGSKQGNVYLVDRSHLSAELSARQACSEDATTDQSLLGPNPQAQFQTVGPLNVFGPYQAAATKVISRMHTTPAFFTDSVNNFVYVTGNTKAPNAAGVLLDAPPDIFRLKINILPGQPAYLTTDAEETTLALLNPSSPVVTSDGSTNPMLWVIDAESSLAEMTVDGVNIAHPILYAVDGTTMTVLWRTGVDELGQGAKFITPVVNDGQVFVATDRVLAYGLAGQ